MTVNFEIKGMLARLLATEDLIVEHQKVETACFNVHTRVLTLPLWEKASGQVYDLLVAHEVGHALYTPDEDWTENYSIPPQFVNVVEDARIEKLMKRKYAGLAKTFYQGYKELNDDDFFSIADDDLSTYNLADRANIYFKVGNFVSLEFNQEEQEIIDQIGAADTFIQTLEAAEALYKYCVRSQEQLTKVPNFDSHENSSEGNQGGQESGESFQPEVGENGVDEDQPNNTGSEGQGSPSAGSKIPQNETQSSDSGGDTADLDVKTMSSLEDSIKELINNSALKETVYVEVPDVNLNSVIISNYLVHKECEREWAFNIERLGSGECFVITDEQYRNFKRSAQKEVNYLVKEFECRKAADSYARASTARTGVLDCSRLHNYKFSEDLFKKVTTLADGKNHGLVFVLDWSGSMSNVILDTVKQLYNLIWFCKKVSIPFEVYAFTNDWNHRVCYDEEMNKVVSTPSEHCQRKPNQLVVDYSFGLLNLFTSKTKTSELEKQMINIFRLAKVFDRSSWGGTYSYPSRLSLSGTPLNEALVSLYKILPKFQQENKLQKVQCVVLTDGEAAPLKYYREVHRRWENESFIGTSNLYEGSFLRDRKTGNVYKVTEEYAYLGFTDLLLQNLRDRFPTVNFIGIRVLGSGDVNAFARRYTGYGVSGVYTDLMAEWKKHKSFSITQSGYHKYFGISANALNTNSSFEISGDATKTQIKSAFVKSLSSKKMNKKVLGEFIELVA
jgi:hypothetical protein